MRKEEGCTKGRMIREEGTSNDEAGKTVAGERSTDKKHATRGRRRNEHGSKEAAGKVNKQKNDCKNDETRSKVEEARTEEEMGNKKKKRARRNQ